MAAAIIPVYKPTKYQPQHPGVQVVDVFFWFGFVKILNYRSSYLQDSSQIFIQRCADSEQLMTTKTYEMTIFQTDIGKTYSILKFSWLRLAKYDSKMDVTFLKAPKGTTRDVTS